MLRQHARAFDNKVMENDHLNLTQPGPRHAHKIANINTEYAQAQRNNFSNLRGIDG